MLWRRQPWSTVRGLCKDLEPGHFIPHQHESTILHGRRTLGRFAAPSTKGGASVQGAHTLQQHRNIAKQAIDTNHVPSTQDSASGVSGGACDPTLSHRTTEKPVPRYDAPSGRDTHAYLLSRGADATPSASSEFPAEKTLAGLVRSIRKQKRISFAHIQDGTTYKPVQTTMEPELAADLSNGAYAELTGIWQPSPGKGQSHELYVTGVQHVGESNAEENPIQKQSMSADYLRNIPHMRIRTSFQSLVARARSHLIQSAGDFFHKDDRLLRSAIQVHPPLITSSDCEGAGEVFTLSPQSYSALPESNDSTAERDKPKLFFREPKYLTVSSQLHLEAWSAELGDVWTLSPTFRAEESDTSRHLAEFYMLEAEFRGTTSLHDITEVSEKLIRYFASSLADHRTGSELLDHHADRKHRPPDQGSLDLEERWSKLLPVKSYPQVTYSDAICELQNAAHKAGFQKAPSWEGGLTVEHERWIVDNIGKGLPTIVKYYPKTQKPFYMLPKSAVVELSKEQFPIEHETAACFDILLPYGYAEVCGGSLREHRLPNLIEAMREKRLLKQAGADEDSSYPYLQLGESLGSLQWYADLRRFGSSPHGGFGLGFDRLLAYLTGASSVRDVVGFPRYWGRAEC